MCRGQERQAQRLILCSRIGTEQPDRIMQIALAEMLTFPNIPISVTINEYVELAKTYSTPKSGGYINGMLDSIARHLVRTGKLMKSTDDLHPRRRYDDMQDEG